MTQAQHHSCLQQICMLQVDLKSASLRPGKDNAWLEALTQRVMTSVSASEARIHVHSGSWLHDLDQVAQHSSAGPASHTD